MKLITTTALALVAAVFATPASAQNKDAQAQAPAAAAQPTIKPSKGALKAIVDLQDTVNKNDFANVPAKVSAANAVATTKEDKYLIGQLQLKAAIAAKDNAAIASAISKRTLLKRAKLYASATFTTSACCCFAALAWMARRIHPHGFPSHSIASFPARSMEL